jgi:protein pelota
VRILHRDHTIGLARLRLETPSDLWRISRLVAPGDRVGASTTRRDPEAPESVAAAEKTRRRVWLVVVADEVEFHGFTRHVRVAGRIVEAPFDLGRHHTLDLAEGEEVSVQKPTWTAADESLLREGAGREGERRILLAAVDWGESSVMRLHGRALLPVADLNRNVAGKRAPGGQSDRDRATYQEELVALLLREMPECDALVLAGPGFLKEAVARAVSERNPAVGRKIRIYPASESGRQGIHELLRSGRATEVLSDSAAAKEAELVEQLVRALAGGRRAAVGPAEVAAALEVGAVETLLVMEKGLREPANVGLIDRARAAGGVLFIVREEGESGKKLQALGGVAALLRFDFVPVRPAAPAPPR